MTAAAIPDVQWLNPVVHAFEAEGTGANSVTSFGRSESDSFEAEEGAGKHAGKNQQKMLKSISDVNAMNQSIEKRRLQDLKLSALFAKHGNRDGIIDVNGFATMMMELGVIQTPEDAAETFRSIDVDDSGDIDSEEFTEFYWATHTYENTASMRFLVAIQSQLAQGDENGMFQSSDKVFQTLAMSTEDDLVHEVDGFFGKLVLMPDSPMRVRWDM